MDVFFCFLVAGVTIVVLILKFDKKQTVKVNTVLRESRAVPPMFLLKATEHKIETLKKILRFDDAPQNMADAGTMADIYKSQRESNRISKVQELKLLSARYNNGQLSLDAYDRGLDELLGQVRSQRGEYVMAS